MQELKEQELGGTRHPYSEYLLSISEEEYDLLKKFKQICHAITMLKMFDLNSWNTQIFISLFTTLNKKELIERKKLHDIEEKHSYAIKELQIKHKILVLDKNSGILHEGKSYSLDASKVTKKYYEELDALENRETT